MITMRQRDDLDTVNQPYPQIYFEVNGDIAASLRHIFLGKKASPISAIHKSLFHRLRILVLVDALVSIRVSGGENGTMR